MILYRVLMVFWLFFWLILVLAAVRVAHAQNAPVSPPTFNVPVTQQDGQNITQICSIAMSIGTLQTRTTIGQVCLEFLARVNAAQQRASQASKAASSASANNATPSKAPSRVVPSASAKPAPPSAGSAAK